MNTAPLFVAPQQACADRARRRLEFLRRRIREIESKVRAYELALTEAALRGRFPSEGPTTNVLRNQIEGLRLEERVAEADLYAAESQCSKQ